MEARHASKVRRLAASPAMQGWIALGEATSAPAPIRPVYQGEDEVIQLGVNVPQIVGSGVTAEDVAESFDEPLTPAEVFAIVDPFIQGDVDGDGTET